MTLIAINPNLNYKIDFIDDSNQLRTLENSSPYREGMLHLGQARNNSSASLATRVTHLVCGLLLLIPIVNRIIFIALQHLRPAVEQRPASLGPRRHRFDNLYHQVYTRIGLGGTALHTLAANGTKLGMIRQLIQDGVDLTIRDRIFQNTPLHWAIANAKNEAAMAILVTAAPGPYLDCQSGNGNTPLHLSIGKGYTTHSADERVLTVSNFEITQALLQRGANPNLKNGLGNTPLHLACARRDFQTIRALLGAGADRNVQNEQNQTPLDVLNLPYEEACVFIRKTVSPFLLDRNTFEGNQVLSRQALGIDI